jgi:SRSO17 transposase
MTGEELLEMVDDLDRYYNEFDKFFGREENQKNGRRFARGQLGPIERKSLEPIADAEGIEPRNLQQFFSRNIWEQCRARDHLQSKVAKEYGGDDGIFLIDETSDAKKGAWTAGVTRQYCGESGKVENCIVSVHLGYTCGDFHCLLDGELFLPESWDPIPEEPFIAFKRKRAAIPDNVVHESKPFMGLRQVNRAIRNGVPGKYLAADELYGRSPWWRREIHLLNLIYVVEVPKNIHGWVGNIDGEARRLDELNFKSRRLRCGKKNFSVYMRRKKVRKYGSAAKSDFMNRPVRRFRSNCWWQETSGQMR